MTRRVLDALATVLLAVVFAAAVGVVVGLFIHLALAVPP